MRLSCSIAAPIDRAIWTTHSHSIPGHSTAILSWLCATRKAACRFTKGRSDPAPGSPSGRLPRASRGGAPARSRRNPNARRRGKRRRARSLAPRSPSPTFGKQAASEQALQAERKRAHAPRL